MVICGLKMHSAWSTPNGLVCRLAGRLSPTSFGSPTLRGRLPLVIGRYRVQEQRLRRIGDVVVVSEFKELYPPSSIFSSSPAALSEKSDGDCEAESSAHDCRRKPHGMGRPLTVPDAQELYALDVGRCVFRGIDSSRVSTYVCVSTKW
jgi:hypothetical protein